MGQITQYGTLNTTALVVPDLYVQIVPPSVLVLNGVPSNRIGAVGTASWGPVNQATIVGNMAGYANAFGAIMARKYDMGTQVAVSVQQGATDFRCVRVTDGTDVPAEATLAAAGSADGWTALGDAINQGNSALRGPSGIVVFSPTETGGIIVALYSGSAGNLILVTISAGSRAGTARAVVTMPGHLPEVFDNVAFTTLPTFTTAILQGGTDGAAGVTAATLVGQDGFVRTGLYALRGTGCSIGLPADCDDSTQWTSVDAYGLGEGTYSILCGPSGDTIENAVAIKAAAGLDSPASKLMFGDWIYWNDAANGVTRLVSPAAFVAGRLANLSPEQSSLNKPLSAVVGSQKGGTPGSAQLGTYSTAELTALFEAGIDVIANPSPGGSYWSVRCGHNTSSDATRWGDNYTRMTNYIATTVNSGMGRYIGQVINLNLFRNERSTLLNFFAAMLGQGMLAENADGSLPYIVVDDFSNNPQSRTGLGYTQADVSVTYLGINEKFILNLEGGSTVVTAQSTGQSIAFGAAA